MCPEEKQPSFTGSEGGRSCNGPMMEKSTASDSPQVSEDIGSTMEKARRKKRKRETFATAESPRRVKRKICDDKSSTCSQSIQGTTLYKTSPADSTSKEKAFGPFFDPRCKKMSEQLSSLTKIDWRDSHIQSCKVHVHVDVFRDASVNDFFSMMRLSTINQRIKLKN